MAELAYFDIDASQLELRDKARQDKSALYLIAIGIVGVAIAAIILGLVGTIIAKGLPAINWEFLSKEPTDGMTKGGIWPMIRGSMLLMGGTLVCVPVIGILGGVWLAEYAGGGRLPQAMRACVTTLAATPPIVYGLFGFAIFVLKWHLGVSLIAGWLTLSMMSIPVVVLTTESAIRSVPERFAEGAMALGLSKWQSIWRVILPNALPGIITGLVLAAGRAMGEAPPILLTAGIYYSTEKLSLGWQTLSRPVANLPYHLAEGYRQGGVIPEKIIWGTCLTLMLFVLVVNLGAIYVRARIRSKQNW